MTTGCGDVAEQCAAAATGARTPGGYDLRALGASLDETVAALSLPVADPVWPAATVSFHARTHVCRPRQAGDRAVLEGKIEE